MTALDRYTAGRRCTYPCCPHNPREPVTFEYDRELVIAITYCEDVIREHYGERLLWLVRGDFFKECNRYEFDSSLMFAIEEEERWFHLDYREDDIYEIYYHEYCNSVDFTLDHPNVLINAIERLRDTYCLLPAEREPSDV